MLSTSSLQSTQLETLLWGVNAAFISVIRGSLKLDDFNARVIGAIAGTCFAVLAITLTAGKRKSMRRHWSKDIANPLGFLVVINFSTSTAVLINVLFQNQMRTVIGISGIASLFAIDRFFQKKAENTLSLKQKALIVTGGAATILTLHQATPLPWQVTAMGASFIWTKLVSLIHFYRCNQKVTHSWTWIKTNLILFIIAGLITLFISSCWPRT